MSHIEIDFIGVETAKSGDAITIRYEKNGVTGVHVVDGGYVDTGAQVIEQLRKFYGTTKIDNVVLTHPDLDHANGLRAVLEECDVGKLWLNRPWLYADELIDRFATYTSVDALERKLRSVYSTGNFEASAPRVGEMLRARQTHFRVVGTGDHYCLERQ
ncbi:hypothetical protein AFK24_24220 [Pseudomonas syringae]|uniref:Metallo-beta-lactamase domain-containing protein n=1 Tax=Pseudomonas syringae TaxID=317 RepID=A0A1C7YYA3_PSESX|nr:hypothetical protein AFK24_24220 [Pseudomonas syringae]